MVRSSTTWIGILALALAACGGGDKKQPTTPKDPPPVVEKPKPVKTEADREHDRKMAALAIVPEGSTCLPTVFKTEAPKLAIAPIGGAPVLCAIDTKPDRLLGVIACWKVAIDTGALTYQEPKPMPGRGYAVKVDDHCARGFCLPKDAKVGSEALVVWNADESKAAVVAGDQLHLFDTATKQHEKSFSLRGEKGMSNDPIGVTWIGEMFFVEGADQGPYSAVWAFKSDGTQVGPIEELGSKDGKAISTYGGSFLVLDKDRVAISEGGLSTLTTYDVATGKRSKITRKVGKLPCKAEELDGYWHDNAGAITPKCKDALEVAYGPFIGADALAGRNNHLFALTGNRRGELAVINPKTLAEAKDKLIKLTWCDAAAAKTE